MTLNGSVFGGRHKSRATWRIDQNQMNALTELKAGAVQTKRIVD